MASTFFELVNSTRSFVTGGSTHVEIWLAPGKKGDTLRENLEENWAGAHQVGHLEERNTVIGNETLLDQYPAGRDPERACIC